MGLEHLQGKRTGRKKGGKNRPLWQRDLEWASKHLGKPDAEPPTNGARFWRGVAETQPDRFAAALAEMDKADHRKPEPTVPAPAPRDRQECGPTPAITRVAQKPQRAKLAFLSLDHLTQLLKGSLHAAGVPSDARCVAASLDRERRGLVLTVISNNFSMVSEGQVIPEMTPLFASGR
jgi:hypothetical protein